jgi:hypothetical protein
MPPLLIPPGGATHDDTNAAPPQAKGPRARPSILSTCLAVSGHCSARPSSQRTCRSRPIRTGRSPPGRSATTDDPARASRGRGCERARGNPMSHRLPHIDTGHRPTAPTTGRIRNVEPASSLAPPPPGRAVLACRCGVMLDLDDMHPPAVPTATAAAYASSRFAAPDARMQQGARYRFRTNGSLGPVTSRNS